MKVLVTGGSGGIGKAIIEIFSKNNHEVYAPTHKELDLSNEVNLNEKSFDIIINNAGINPLNPFHTSNYKEVLSVNFLSPLEIIKQCLPYMITNNYGRIVNVGSIWINLAKSERSAYSFSKSALHSLTKSLTSEYGSKNILTNTISPGFIATELTFKNNSESNLSKIKKETPLGRLGLPEEIAKLVYFLSVENTFICGQNIIIDGGYSCTRI
jgi:NAD(P)-dependent dehydrogenase (short-subunit alcohol dehydrogenase family)